LVESRLQEALQYSLWLEEENYRAYRQVYGAALPFPLNRILAYVAVKRLEAQFKSQEIDQVLIRAEVYRHAEQAYSALAVKLGDQRYFFGDRPTGLDAAVLAHLLFLEKAKLVRSMGPS
jgi:metaxin